MSWWDLISGLLVALAVLVMAGSLLLVPLGIPGLWIMIAVLLVGAIAGRIGWWLLLLFVLIAAAAELAELFAVRAMNVRSGGSPRAFVGAIVGGLAGVVIGFPVPVVGPLIAGILGTFIGAGLVAYHETRELGPTTRIAWGTVLGRAVAAVIKTAAGLAILVWGGLALWRG